MATQQLTVVINVEDVDNNDASHEVACEVALTIRRMVRNSSNGKAVWWPSGYATVKVAGIQLEELES